MHGDTVRERYFLMRQNPEIWYIHVVKATPNIRKIKTETWVHFISQTRSVAPNDYSAPSLVEI